MSRVRSIAASGLLCVLSCLALITRLPADEIPAKDLEFFEKKIRPLLAENCLACHGAEPDIKGNLRLDSVEAWLAGGDSGPAIVPGKPQDSLLIAAVRYEHEYLEMPPDGKLPEAKLALLEEWVRRGAPGPRASAPQAQKKSGMSIEEGKTFWAYELLQVPIAKPSDPGDLANAIDDAIAASLDAAGLVRNPAADRTALVRRVYFDLHGLPPTVDQIDAFLQDESPGAYERLVDQLLASPRFGERWGRHWLDIVRFGESVTLRGMIMPHAWRYRDYVIDQFNADRPFDQFLREQIAGDLLPAGTLEDKQRHQVAVTFLTLGNTNLEEQDKKQLDMDVVDEQLDTLGKAFLAQTIGCARCHDHKFDPIPTKDYYALAGILRNVQVLDHENVSKWKFAPLSQPPAEQARFDQMAAQIAAFQKQSEELKQQITALDADSKPTSTTGPKVLPIADLPGIVVDDTQAKKVGVWQDSQYSKRYVGSGYTHDQHMGKGDKTLTFAPELPNDGRYEVRFAYTSGSNRASNVPVTVFGADGEKTLTIDEQQAPAIDGFFVSLGEYRFEKAGQSFVLIGTAGTDGHVIADAVQFIPVDELSRPPQDAATNSERSRDLERRRQELADCQQRLKDLRAMAAARPQSMALAERSTISDCPIHMRGSVHTLGETAPRGFLQVLPAAWPEIPDNESGRRQLAEWLTSPENPLPARVYVNRCWHWLFGAGLVRTTDNFGTTGELPSHPQLLDHLAAEFIASGWSSQRLVRSIVLSETYRQSSAESLDGLAKDPENRLLWRMNRKRLEAECLRDAMLLVSGELDFTTGGPTFKPGLASDYGYRDSTYRRSVYVPVFRNALPEIFEAFDFADPSMVVGVRSTSTVAPQALFLLNDPFVLERARSAAKRLLHDAADTDARTTLAFRRTLGRAPTPAERQAVLQFIANQNTEGAWARLVQSLFASLDFRYRD